MRPFLEEISIAYREGLYSVALSSALLVPDACGAVEHPALRNGERYIAWYDSYVASLYTTPRPKFAGALIWKIRNGMIHETTLNFSAFGIDQVIFTLPESGMSADFCHGVSLDDHGKTRRQMTLDLKAFIDRVERGAQNWLRDIAGDTEKKKRLDGLIQLRMGMPPLIGSFLVIA